MKDLDYLILLGNRIRELRKSKKLSQLELAVAIDNHPEQIGRLERGKLNFTICTLQKICKALEITEKEFFSF